MGGDDRRPAKGPALLVAFCLLIGVGLPLLASVPAAAAAGTSTGLSVYADIAVDPVSGRVFVSGDDKVVAFAPDGSPLGTTANVFGARGLAFGDGYLWAAETTAGAIAKIDPTTLAKVGEYAIGSPVGPSIAVVGDRIYLTTPGSGGIDVNLNDLDPATGTVSMRGSVAGDVLNAIPGSTTELLINDRGLSPYSVYLYDLTTSPVTFRGDVPHGLGSNLRGIAVTEVGTFVPASGAPYRFDEVSTTPVGSLLEPTGVVYPATNYPNGIAYSPAKGGVFAGTTQSTNKLFVARRGVPLSSHEVALTGTTQVNGVDLAPDASRAYVVTLTSGALVLNTVSLTPTLTGATVTTVTQDRTVRTVLSGTGLGGITGATLGGIPVDLAHDGPNSLVLDVRTTLPTGPATLTLTSPWGQLSMPFTVVANTSGTVTGRVTADGAAVPDATVTVVDTDGLARTGSTGADGRFAIADVPAGDHVDISIADAPARHRWSDQTLTGSGPWSYDVDLHRAPPTGLERRRLHLPPGEVRRVVNDPATGRTFIAVGDTIVVTDADGREIGRIADQWTVDDLQVVGSKLYAMLHHAGSVSVVDTTTLAVTKSWPVQRANTGSFAVTGNRLHFVDGDDQSTHLAALDLTTGAIAAEPSGIQFTPLLAPIAGTSQAFLSWEVGISSSNVIHWDASGASIVKVAVTPFSTFGYHPADFVASATDGKVWAADGRELSLATMTLTGVTYPTSGARAAARSAGHGGVLLFGDGISLQGTPTRSHTLPAAPTYRAGSLDAAGDRAYVATDDGQLVVADLAPVVNQTSPEPIPTTPTAVALSGAGLGATSAVRVDGTSVPFSVVDDSHLNVSVPLQDEGGHLITVETPWGVSSPRTFTVGTSLPGYHPFASWAALVQRQFSDMTGIPPTAKELNDWVTALSTDAKEPGDLIAALRLSPDNTDAVDPAARLYRAFLGRTPDPDGFSFWVKRRRTGAWSLVRMADQFARSSEFTRKYGVLSNRAFVERIYVDVLGRPADPGGVDYWTRQLDLRRRTRGSLMVGFSESTEYKRKQAANTDVGVAYLFLLGRAPDGAELDDWVTREHSGTTIAELAGELLATDEYIAHVGS